MDWIKEALNNPEFVTLMQNVWYGVAGSTAFTVLAGFLKRAVRKHREDDIYAQEEKIEEAFMFCMDASLKKALSDECWEYDEEGFRGVFKEKFGKADFAFSQHSFLDMVLETTGAESIGQRFYENWVHAFYICVCMPQADPFVKFISRFGIVPTDVSRSIISRIDENYIKANIVPEDSPALDAYYRLDCDIDIVSKAVCSNHIVIDDDLLESILETARDTKAVLFICGDGGIGKTTLLLTLSVELSKECPVYFVQLTANMSAEGFMDELDRAFPSSRSLPTLCYLFIDNPTSNPDIIEKVHNWLPDHGGVAAILADRALNFHLLFDSTCVLPYWKEACTYVFIGQKKTEFFSAMNRNNVTIELSQDANWKQYVVDKMITNISRRYGVDECLLKGHMDPGLLSERAPFEVFYYACINYNKAQMDASGVAIEPKIKFAWNEWDDIFGRDRPEFVRVFRVIAALALFSIPTSVEVISKYLRQNTSDVVFALAKIPGYYGAPIKRTGALITTCHDLIAEFYFYAFDPSGENRIAESTLLDVVGCLDDDSVIEFERKVFRKAFVRRNDAPFKVNARNLLREFTKPDYSRYRELLKEKGRLYSLDMAIVWASLDDVDDGKKAEIWDSFLSEYPDNIRVVTEFFHSTRNLSSSSKDKAYGYLDSFLAKDIRTHAPSLNELAIFFRGEGAYGKAVDILEQIINGNKDDFIAKLTLATTLSKLNSSDNTRNDGQLREAEILLLEIIGNDRSVHDYSKANACTCLAKLYGGNKPFFNKSQADIVQLYEAAIAFKPDQDSYKRALADYLAALCVQDMTEKEDAKAYADKAIGILERLSGGPRTWSILAKLYGSRKNPRHDEAKAYRYYHMLFPELDKKVWDRLPSDYYRPDAQILFAQFLADHGELDKSERLFRNMLHRKSHAQKAREGLDELSFLRGLLTTFNEEEIPDSSGTERTRDFKKRMRAKGKR